MGDSTVRNIVICGASWAGLSTAHYFLKHIYPTLKSTSNSLYRVVLINPSTHFYYKVGAPRAAASSKSLPHDKLFTPIVDGFQQYGKDAVTFHYGEATSVDQANHNVNFQLADGTTGTVRYYALVIATGANTPTPLTSLHGDHNKTIQAIDSMNDRLRQAKEVVITGGGPVGVETAGEIGEALNGQSGLNSRKVKITLIAGGKRIIPVLRESLSQRAEKMLNKVGVEILYSSRVKRVELGGQDTSTEKGFDTTDDNYAETGGSTQANGGIQTTRNNDPSGKTIIYLENGTKLTADVYIPATGVTPNTSFLPREWVDEKGFVKTNSSTLRVDVAGTRVYCIGDCGNYSNGGILDLYAAMPVMATNMWNDLVHANKEGGAKNGAKDRFHKSNPNAETQVVPIGRGAGVGAFNGYKLPTFMVKMIKGKDYMIGERIKITHGGKWAKP